MPDVWSDPWVTIRAYPFPWVTSRLRPLEVGYVRDIIIAIAWRVNWEIWRSDFIQRPTDISIKVATTQQFAAGEMVNTTSDLEKVAVGSFLPAVVS